MFSRALWCIRIASIIYFLLAAFFVVLGFYFNFEEGLGITIFYAIFILGAVFWCEITIWGLKRVKHWAWVSSIIMFAMFIPSLFIILGILGMRTMLSENVRNLFFGKQDQSSNIINKRTFINTDTNYVKKEDESIDKYIENTPALQRYLNYDKDDNKK